MYCLEYIVIVLIYEFPLTLTILSELLFLSDELVTEAFCYFHNCYILSPIRLNFNKPGAYN